jgi:hypothetical protein
MPNPVKENMMSYSCSQSSNMNTPRLQVNMEAIIVLILALFHFSDYNLNCGTQRIVGRVELGTSMAMEKNYTQDIIMKIRTLHQDHQFLAQ